jgi:hypothetical protein
MCTKPQYMHQTCLIRIRDCAYECNNSTIAHSGDSELMQLVCFKDEIPTKLTKIGRNLSLPNNNGSHESRMLLLQCFEHGI